MIYRTAEYHDQDRSVVLALDGGSLALRLKKAKEYVTAAIALERDNLSRFEFDVRQRYGPEARTPRLVAGDVEIVSEEPLKVRVLLKGKPFIEGPLDPLLFTVRAQIANWNSWEMRESRKPT